MCRERDQHKNHNDLRVRRVTKRKDEIVDKNTLSEGLLDEKAGRWLI